MALYFVRSNSRRKLAIVRPRSDLPTDKTIVRVSFIDEIAIIFASHSVNSDASHSEFAGQILDGILAATYVEENSRGLPHLDINP